jgi:5'-3' exonuclease
VRLHLVDGTYELFRAHFGALNASGDSGTAFGATRGILWSLLSLLGEHDVSHVAVAFDHVIESFRNDLYTGYKTSEGVPADLLAQFQLAEQATHALGLVVWPMIELEADDALATAAERWGASPEVEQVVICTPDKDMSQCVQGSRVVCLDRMRRRVIDEAAVVIKFGVRPASIPDWLALVGDSADGYPGVPRWGATSASALLAHYGGIDAIPDDERRWAVKVRGAAGLAASLRAHRDDARLYRVLATLRTDASLTETLDDLRWRGARRDELVAICRDIGEERLLERVTRWRD